MARARKPGDAKVAIGYLRVSTDKQHLGPDAQRAAIEAWAKAEGIQIAAWFVDEDTSGGSELSDRPGLMAAIAALRAQRAGLLAVAKRDRLARSVEVVVALERAIRGAGAIVASADGRNDESPGGKLVRQIEDAVAEHERALISERTKSALAVKRRRGQAAGGTAPYGFRLDPNGPRSSSGRPMQLVPDEHEQTVCARVMRMKYMGFTEKRIEEELRWSVKGRTGHTLGPAQIHAIIANCPRLRAIFSDHARSAPAGAYACARGHVYDVAMAGKYCLRDHCREGRGDGSSDRRITLRS